MSRLRSMKTADTASHGPALKSIGELSAETGIPHHILRYWESRFEQLRPVTRAGNRRYYRPEHVALVKRINTLLHDEGYTIRGVRHVLQAGEASPLAAPMPVTPTSVAPIEVMLTVRDRLSAALAADEAS